MDVGEQCVVRDGGTQRLVWSVLDWDSQEKVNIKKVLHIATYCTYRAEKEVIAYRCYDYSVQSRHITVNIYNLTCLSPQSDPPDCTAVTTPWTSE